MILSNRKEAYVIERAKKHGISWQTFDRKTFYESNEILNLLVSLETDLVILAGFLWLVPSNLIERYKGRIINIHPALLPKFGGKGMYGSIVHESVIRAGEKESGITIHYVNEKYDEGDIIFQARCSVVPGESPESLAAKVHELEYAHFPKIIENLLFKN
jgi:phosphoribosylglycinamide formyltransferase-1